MNRYIIKTQVDYKNSNMIKPSLGEYSRNFTPLNLIPTTQYPDYQRFFNTPEVFSRSAGVRLCNSKESKYFPVHEDNSQCFQSACSTIYPCSCNDKKKCLVNLASLV
jgi:hypothetical protein